MVFKKIILMFNLAMLIIYIAACASLKIMNDLPLRHPEDIMGQGRPMCTNCHEPEDDTFAYSLFNHTLYFIENHRFQAKQTRRTCMICHQERTCNECHALRLELNPSIKSQAEPFRRTPHLGDYVSRHAIEGRIDPVSCFRCHGNPKTSKTCGSCHG